LKYSCAVSSQAEENDRARHERLSLTARLPHCDPYNFLKHFLSSSYTISIMTNLSRSQGLCSLHSSAIGPDVAAYRFRLRASLCLLASASVSYCAIAGAARIRLFIAWDARDEAPALIRVM
jgi:hypothetical protein